jgi:hypothetical protein
MHKLRLFALTAVVLFALCAVSPATNFIVNGSFENSSFNCGGTGYCLGLVGSAVPGWFIPSSDGTYPWGLTNTNPFNAGPTPYGNQWFVLGEVASGVDYTIQQTMTGLTPGDTYHLSFAIASESGCCSVADVSFLSGSSTGPMDFTALPSGQWWQTQTWSTQNEDFLATSSSVTIQFKDLAAEFPGGIDLGLDNVIVTSAATTPEPGSLLLFGSGLLAGLGVLRRKRNL